jgi:hypothetical protein
MDEFSWHDDFTLEPPSHGMHVCMMRMGTPISKENLSWYV